MTVLARRSGLPNATTHRLLRQLVDVGAVERRAVSYSLGAALQELGEGWEPSLGLRATAREPLRQLAAANASLALVVARTDRFLVLEHAEGTAPDPPPDPRSYSAALASGLDGKDRTVKRGGPDTKHDCVAATVDVREEPGLVAVAALLPVNGPVEHFAGAVAKLASKLGRTR